jgi:hypothetical protein
METNLNEVREMARVFLRLPIQLDEKLHPLLCVHHPFISSCVVYVDGELINILENPERLEEFNKYIEEEIDDSDLFRIYVLVRAPYRLTFLKYCEPYLSPKDLAELFADAWVSTENPNQDANCPIHYLVKMFKKCDKKYLMSEEDYQVYEQLPETFTIYRGVAVGRNPKGLSWTKNLETAKWFAHRFDREDKKGYIQMGIAKKEDVLAYFNTRNEDEIVYNSKRLQISIYEEE